MSHTTVSHTFTRLVLGTGLAYVAVAAALSASPSAVAKPLSEQTIKSECKAAGGGYSSQVRGGVRFSQCVYKDSKGGHQTDFYEAGEYFATVPV